MLVTFFVYQASDLLSIIFIVLTDVVLQSFNEKILVQARGIGLELAEFVDTVL